MFRMEPDGAKHDFLTLRRRWSGVRIPPGAPWGQVLTLAHCTTCFAGQQIGSRSPLLRPIHDLLLQRIVAAMHSRVTRQTVMPNIYFAHFPPVRPPSAPTRPRASPFCLRSAGSAHRETGVSATCNRPQTRLILDALPQSFSETGKSW
jgi:hypothetical protein